MDLIDHYRKQFEYDAWANRTVMEALRMMGNPPPMALQRLSHIVAAQMLWLRRLSRQPNSPSWPNLSLDECEVELRELPERWKEFLRSFSVEQFEAQIPYLSADGTPWSNTGEEILSQVILHAAYHRGQIAADMRAAGFEPVNTDFTHATRSGLVAR